VVIAVLLVVVGLKSWKSFTEILEHYQQRFENISKILSCSQIYHMPTPNLAAYLNLSLKKTFFPRKIRVGFVMDKMLLGVFLFPCKPVLPCVTITPVFHTHIRSSINIPA
jgi:hypothetical protein